METQETAGAEAAVTEDERFWAARARDADERIVWHKRMFAVFRDSDEVPLSLHGEEHEAWAFLLTQPGRPIDYRVRVFELAYVHRDGKLNGPVQSPAFAVP